MNSNRKVIGFDLFNPSSNIIDTYVNKSALKIVLNRVPADELSYDTINNNLQNVNNDQTKYILIKGDVCESTRTFIQNNRGCRIALIYMDLDLSEPTYYALKNMWDNLLPGGIVIFDEYEYHKFDESCGVDLFLKNHKIKYDIISTNFASPTAYIIKKDY